MVCIPPSVLLKGLDHQREFIVGQFMNCSAPFGGLIHGMATRIWGKKCKIFTKQLGESSFLFHIPDESTRNWAISRGIWYVDDCLMFVSAWNPSETISLPEIKTIPIWLTLKNIPFQLYSIEGIDWIASAIGEPMLTSKPWLDPTSIGEAKILVEVKLDRPFPKRVALQDKEGTISLVDIVYSWLPSSCTTCGQFKEVDAASTHSALLQNTAPTVPIPTFSTATTTYLALPPSLAIEQSPPKVTSEADTNQLADITSAQLDLHSVTAFTNTETSTETATFSPSADEQDLNKSPTTPKQGTETSTLTDEDNNMCLVLSSVNTTDSRCDKNKLDNTAGLEVSDPTNEIDSSKEAAEIASANGIVSVASSHAVNLPLDKVFASSPPIFVTGPGTAGASFTSDDDLIHRTRGGRLIKPSLKGTEFEWTLVGGRVAEAARRAILSQEEKKELERQLKAINKPAIKSFKTEHDEIFDCIDIHKQLAFDHHLLKNHTVQMKPTSVPKWNTSNNNSQKVDPLQLLPRGISCPDGTFATVDYEYSTVSGVKGNINLWDLQVSQDQVSLATMAIAGGPIENLASISVGWMVNPLLYQDHIHLYTYWTADGYKKTGCHDIGCPGFVQVSKRIPLGVLKPVSIYDGTQYQMELSLHQDRATRD
ncbi:hypothetical protein Bca4012_080197 [Brassica carinata]